MSSILIISPEPWDHIFVSKHHYAIELARRGHTVLFYGPPDGTGLVSIETVEMQGVSIGVVHGPKVAPGLRYMPARLRVLLEMRWLASLERKAKCSIDVVWLFENSRFYDMRFAGTRLKIYQQVDLDQDFHPHIAAGTSDLAVAISQPIRCLLKTSTNKLVQVTHGFSEKAHKPLANGFLDQQFSGAKVHALFAGNMDRSYLDVPLFVDLVKANPTTHFHFVGHYTEKCSLYVSLATAPNTSFWGRQPAESLPSIYERADILLVVSLADQHLKQLANPHKIMEYLASGKVVLATRTLEYDDKPELVCVAGGREDYLKKFREIVDDLHSWNAPERMARRRKFAQGNTYAHQVDRIASALGERGDLIA